ncbi:MAG: hypothetical protein ACYC64_12915 [Armatimonadota bacterium]
MKTAFPVLTLIIALASAGVVMAGNSQIGNLGYNSYEGALSGGGQTQHFGSGVGYPTQLGADYFHRYIPSGQWGKYGYGTGHLGQGYGPYVFPDLKKGPPPGMFDPLPGEYDNAPPPKIKVSRGTIRVGLPGNIPGVRCVTVTVLAFNGAELCSQTLSCAPYAFNLPVLDGAKNLRVRIDYVNNGLSATSYPL